MRKNSKTKFKKFLALFLSMIIMLGVFSGCGKTETENNSDVGNSSEKEDADLKLHSIGNISSKLKTTKIVSSGDFSEGLCLVELQNEEDVTYCIDKDGDIKFKINKNLYERRFLNGLVIYEYTVVNANKTTIRGFVNQKGEIIYAEDVGVTNFYPVALNEGYIIADIVTSTFNSAKTEVGIMDTNFKWIVEPSEELYNKLCNEYGSFAIDYAENDIPAANGYYYVDELKVFLDLETGKVHYDAPDDFPLELLQLTSGNSYVDHNGNVLIDLSRYSENSSLILGSFNNGYAPIVFYNQASNKSFFTLIDNKGEFNFEPVEICEGRVVITDFEFDGKYMLITDGRFSQFGAKCFNDKGGLVGEWNKAGDTADYRYSLCDGVIIRAKSLGYGDYEYTYYNPDFTPLF